VTASSKEASTLAAGSGATDADTVSVSASAMQITYLQPSLEGARRTAWTVRSNSSEDSGAATGALPFRVVTCDPVLFAESAAGTMTMHYQTNPVSTMENSGNEHACNDGTGGGACHGAGPSLNDGRGG